MHALAPSPQGVLHLEPEQAGEPGQPDASTAFAVGPDVAARIEAAFGAGPGAGLQGERGRSEAATERDPRAEGALEREDASGTRRGAEAS